MSKEPPKLKINSPNKLLKHITTHWPGYGAVGLGGLLAYKHVKKHNKLKDQVKQIQEVANANP